MSLDPFATNLQELSCKGVTKKRKRKTENGRLFGGNMPRKHLLGIPKKVEELPDFGLFGGNFQNRRKSLKRISNQPEKFVANKIGTTAFEVRKLDPESI